MVSAATPRVLIAGYHHETNTFATEPADWHAFTRGDSFPAYMRGQAVLERFATVNVAIGGFMRSARERGWEVLPSAWAAAMPSSYVTRAAFETIATAICDDARLAWQQGALDAIYLDLHGAAAAEHAFDSEGELLSRLRDIVGPALPIVCSLDLHANVTQRMLDQADALVAYRTYPHVDMASTGALAAELLARRWRVGAKETMHAWRFDYLIPLNAQCTLFEPARGIYQLLQAIEAETGTVLSFCPGFPSVDFEECGPVIWGYGDGAPAAVARLVALASDPAPWRLDLLPAAQAVTLALAKAATADKPVIIADTQDNPGVGGEGNTTGLLRALLAAGAGHQFPGRVALGMVCDPAAVKAAHQAGAGAQLDLSLGAAVPTFTGALSDPPVHGRFTVIALGDGHCRFTGPMMPGLELQLGPCACLELDGIRIAVLGCKKQLLDRALLRMLGIEPEAMRVIVVKSSVHFRADFQRMAEDIIVAKAAGPMAADPADLPWTRLPASMRLRP